MGRFSDRRRQLYELYTNDFARHTTGHWRVFACPFCLRCFDESALDKDELALGHIIPEKLHGRLQTLVCKACDNRHGTDIDAHLVERIKVDDGGPLETVLRHGDETMRCVTSAVPHDGKIIPCLSFDGKRNDPKILARSDEFLRKFRASISYGYIPRRSRLAELKSAYLTLFTYFGYEYLANAPGGYAERVRQQLIEPSREILNPLTQAHTETPWHDPTQRKPFVTIVTDPPEGQCIHVMLNLTTDKPRYHSVVFPGFGEDALDKLAWWEAQKGGEKRNYQAVSISVDLPKVRESGIFPSLVRWWRELTL